MIGSVLVMKHINNERGYSNTERQENKNPINESLDQAIENTYFQPVIQALKKLSTNAKQKIIAIDGRCGSGKTTMSQIIQEAIDCNIIHMDDFFLPGAMKTNERHTQPGGNVHYERVKSEVLEPWKNNPEDSLSYQPFNCSTQTLDSSVYIPYKQLNIIEGVYSMHPALINFYDYKIFLTVDKSVQIDRIKKRNPEKLQMFLDQWIPLEERY